MSSFPLISDILFHLDFCVQLLSDSVTSTVTNIVFPQAWWWSGKCERRWDRDFPSWLGMEKYCREKLMRDAKDETEQGEEGIHLFCFLPHHKILQKNSYSLAFSSNCLPFICHFKVPLFLLHLNPLLNHDLIQQVSKLSSSFLRFVYVEGRTNINLLLLYVPICVISTFYVERGSHILSLYGLPVWITYVITFYCDADSHTVPHNGDI